MIACADRRAEPSGDGRTLPGFRENKILKVAGFRAFFIFLLTKTGNKSIISITNHTFHTEGGNKMPYSDDNKRFMGATKVGTKGQIVIPKEVRDMFSIKPGDTLVILADSEKGIVIQNVESLVALTDSVFDRKSRSADVVSSIKDTKAFASYSDEIKEEENRNDDGNKDR